MSNNRMYLACECGKQILLYKLWGGEAARWSSPEAVDKFVEEHFFCENKAKHCDGTSFKIEYEDPNLGPLEPEKP